MHNQKLLASSPFPDIPVFDQSDQKINLKETIASPWKMIVVCRGKHCPLCVKFL